MDRVSFSSLSSFLADEPGILIRKNVPVSMLTSIRIGGNAALTLTPRDGGCLIRLLDRLSHAGILYRVIGNGTNLIGPDAGYGGALIPTAGIDRISVSGSTLVTGAGVPLGRAIRRAMEAGLSGLEALYGIPGTVGGALYMTAGAFGHTVSERLRYATVYRPASGEVTVKTPRSLDFGYRTGAIRREGTVVLSAAFSLTPDAPERIARRMSEIIEKRRATHPIDLPSAGSFFRRPDPDRPVGRLIADAGCAGMTEGGAAVSTMHAGFIVNTGGATESDVRRLAERVRERVAGKYGIELQTEVEYLSDLGAYQTGEA
ncbi:MAG: UDP-N-acetylmuramate dehydrogenase [Clostridia bacterium]|nr:UDP-N-acetylmuramate dehydrogenase [Clostridia bacterium]